MRSSAFLQGLDLINDTYLLSVQHQLRFPTRQELPGEDAVFQLALAKTLKNKQVFSEDRVPSLCFYLFF